MNKWAYVGLAVVAGIATIVAAGILTSQPGVEQPQEGWIEYDEPVTKYIGGKYNATLILLARLGEQDSGDIVYTRDGVERRGYFFSAFQPALDYLKNNTTSDATVLSWWDYGNMIIGYGEREAIATNPSESLLPSVTNTSANVVTDPEEDLRDIGKVLTTADPQEALNILKKHGAEYVFVPAGPLGDEGKARWIFYAGGVSLDDMDDYWVEGRIVGKGMDTLLYRMLYQQEIPGFRLVYSDAVNHVYQAIG